MDKIQASVQHVSIFRIGSVYLIGVLYDVESENQIGSLDIIVQGNNISFGINSANDPRTVSTSLTSAAFHILSETSPVPVFNVNKGNNIIISVPVFSLAAHDRMKVAYELSGVISPIRPSLSIVPNVSAGLPADVLAELGMERGGPIPAREWGWNGW